MSYNKSGEFGLSVIHILILINYIVCVMFILDMIFYTKKKPERIIAWTIFMMIPFLGLFIYIIVGAGLSFFVKRMIKKYRFANSEYNKYIESQIKTLETLEEPKSYPAEFTDLILLNLNTTKSIYSLNNEFDYFLDGPTVYEKLKQDIENAKSSIHIEFYIFANDKTGKDMIKLLTKKASEGVEVRVLYDAIGSIRTSKINFRKFKKAGGKLAVFFPPFLNIKLLNFKANYRNHRKICVIDGKIAYTGGFNIRDDHMGKVKRLSPWRDTSGRFVGGVVHSFQNIFLSDWRFASRDTSSMANYRGEKYFPSLKQQNIEGKVPMQFLTSGPDNNGEAIKECMLKMMQSAKKSIKIQSPYFIPDETFLGTIKLALLSGVEVSLMLPKKIDHWYVHYGGYSYINDLLKFGLKVYIYDGFIHSKVLLVDDKVITFGSCNIDIRSFALNFEDNVVVYDEQKAVEYAGYFNDDIKKCKVYDDNTSKKRNIFAKLLTSFCRLFSAIL